MGAKKKRKRKNFFPSKWLSITKWFLLPELQGAADTLPTILPRLKIWADSSPSSLAPGQVRSERPGQWWSWRWITSWSWDSSFRCGSGVQNLLSQDWCQLPENFLAWEYQHWGMIPEVVCKRLPGCSSSYHTFQSFPTFSLSGSNLGFLTRKGEIWPNWSHHWGRGGGRGKKSLKNCTQKRLARLNHRRILRVLCCYYYYYFLMYSLWPCCKQELSFLTRDQTHVPCIRNTVLTTGLPGSPRNLEFWQVLKRSFCFHFLSL